MTARFHAYLDMLSKDRYTTSVAPSEQLRGLALSREMLERVLHRNYEEFVAKRPQGTTITREIDWSRIGVKRIRSE
jgi:hypothetical protein